MAFAAGSEPARGVLQFYAAALFMFVLVTLAQTVAAGAPRAAVALALLAVVGMTAGAGFAVDNIHGALLDDAYLVDDGGTAGILVSQIPGLMGPIAWVGFGVALLQAGVQPRWSGWALIAGGILFPVSRIGDIAPLAIADDLIFLVALAPLGLALMQGASCWRATGRARPGDLAAAVGDVGAALSVAAVGRAGAAVELVLVAAAEEPVHAAVAEQPVVVAAAVDCRRRRRRAPRLAGAGLQHVVAGAAAQHVGARAALQRVGARPAADRVVARTTVDLVVAAQADDDVVSARAAAGSLLPAVPTMVAAPALAAGLHRDRHGRDVGVREPVVGAVGERHRPDRVLSGRVAERPVRLQDERPARRARHEHGGQRVAVGVRVVVQHAARRRGQINGPPPIAV